MSVKNTDSVLRDAFKKYSRTRKNDAVRRKVQDENNRREFDRDMETRRMNEKILRERNEPFRNSVYETRNALTRYETAFDETGRRHPTGTLMDSRRQKSNKERVPQKLRDRKEK